MMASCKNQLHRVYRNYYSARTRLFTKPSKLEFIIITQPQIVWPLNIYWDVIYTVIHLKSIRIEEMVHHLSGKWGVFSFTLRQSKAEGGAIPLTF